MRITLRVLLVCVTLSLAQSISGQSRDIRSQSEYHDGNLAIKSKAAYYYDFWSEQEIRHGRYTEWDKSGNMILDCQYAEGRLEGLHTRYYSNGNTMEISYWQEGKRSGSQEQYDRSGVLRVSCTYQEGRLNGTYRKYNKQGHLLEVIPYVSGRKEGEVVSYSPTGEVRKAKLFHQGREVKEKKEKALPEQEKAPNATKKQAQKPSQKRKSNQKPPDKPKL